MDIWSNLEIFSVKLAIFQSKLEKTYCLALGTGPIYRPEYIGRKNADLAQMLMKRISCIIPLLL